jgi:hypothetical protein
MVDRLQGITIMARYKYCFSLKTKEKRNETKNKTGTMLYEVANCHPQPRPKHDYLWYGDGKSAVQIKALVTHDIFTHKLG